MNTVLVKNAYNILQTTNNIITTDNIMNILYKFLLKVFNKLVYKWKINGFFDINLLLDLLEYYIILCDINSIHIKLLCSYFYKLAFNRYNQTIIENNCVVLQ